MCDHKGSSSECGGKRICLFTKMVVLAAFKVPTMAFVQPPLWEKFAEALGAVVNILDPDAIVIGGGVGNLDLLYMHETRAAVQKHLFNDLFDTPLLRPTLGDCAGVFGAAMLLTG